MLIGKLSEDGPMLRYRITTDPNHRYIVLPAWTAVSAAEDTYASRQAARDMADWYNALAEQEGADQNGAACGVAVRR